MSVSLEGGSSVRSRSRKVRLDVGGEEEDVVDDEIDVNDDGGEDDEDEEEWKWESGRVRHTWPVGYMTWVVGRRDRRSE